MQSAIATMRCDHHSLYSFAIGSAHCKSKRPLQTSSISLPDGNHGLLLSGCCSTWLCSAVENSSVASELFFGDTVAVKASSVGKCNAAGNDHEKRQPDYCPRPGEDALLASYTAGMPTSLEAW